MSVSEFLLIVLHRITAQFDVESVPTIRRRCGHGNSPASVLLAGPPFSSLCWSAPSKNSVKLSALCSLRQDSNIISCVFLLVAVTISLSQCGDPSSSTSVLPIIVHCAFAVSQTLHECHHNNFNQPYKYPLLVPITDPHFTAWQKAMQLGKAEVHQRPYS